MTNDRQTKNAASEGTSASHCSQARCECRDPRTVWNGTRNQWICDDCGKPANAPHQARRDLDHDKYYHAYLELKDAAIALVQRLELDKDVKKNNWWLNERAKIMEVIDDNKEL